MPFISTDRATFDAAANRYSLSIDENSPAGTEIGRVSFDGGGPGTTYFTILGADAAKVRIDDDGVIRLADGVTLDHEGADGARSLSIEISALFFGDDGTVDSGATSGSKITVRDVDEGPTLTTRPAAASFEENSPAGVVVATFEATDEDGDTVTYDLTGTYADLFQIVGSEVRLKEAGKFDFETLGAGIDLTLTATSTGSSGVERTASQALRVNITDVNEPTGFDAVTPFEIAENSAGGTAVGQVTARDGDGDPVAYSLGSHTDKFVIDSTTGAISVRDGVVLDHETDAEITLTVNAVATGPNGRTSSAAQDVTIRIADRPEPPALTVTPATAPVDEHAARDTVVASFVASDPDGDPVRVFVTGEHARLFTIVGTDLVVADPEGLDYETHGGRLDVTLTAASRADGAPRFWTAGHSPCGWRISTRRRPSRRRATASPWRRTPPRASRSARCGRWTPTMTARCVTASPARMPPCSRSMTGTSWC